MKRIIWFGMLMALLSGTCFAQRGVAREYSGRECEYDGADRKDDGA